jgi:hypothetical protein
MIFSHSLGVISIHFFVCVIYGDIILHYLVCMGELNITNCHTVLITDKLMII